TLSSTLALTGTNASELDVSLQGIGVSPGLSIMTSNPSSDNFMQVHTDCAPQIVGPLREGAGNLCPQQHFVITNQGPKTISNFTATITSASGDTSFSVINETGSVGAFRLCDSLAPQQSCKVTVEFKPDATGTLSSTLALTGTNASELDVSLQGIGVSPGLSIMTSNPSSDNFMTAHTDCHGVSGGFVGDPAFWFGNTCPEHHFIITNQGPATVSNLTATISSGDHSFVIVSVTGSFGPDPSISDCTTLLPQESCKVTVRFEPDNTGPLAATLSLRGTNAAKLDVSLKGTGVSSG
ncbi:MAG: choice-of-anchor D domain-containing protein, partial [Actinomycetota bacterium]